MSILNEDAENKLVKAQSLLRGENYDDIKPEANNLHIYVHKQTGSKHKNSRLLIEGVENDVKTFKKISIFDHEFQKNLAQIKNK